MRCSRTAAGRGRRWCRTHAQAFGVRGGGLRDGGRERSGHGQQRGQRDHPDHRTGRPAPTAATATPGHAAPSDTRRPGRSTLSNGPPHHQTGPRRGFLPLSAAVNAAVRAASAHSPPARPSPRVRPGTLSRTAGPAHHQPPPAATGPSPGCHRLTAPVSPPSRRAPPHAGSASSGSTQLSKTGYVRSRTGSVGRRRVGHDSERVPCGRPARPRGRTSHAAGHRPRPRTDRTRREQQS